MWRVWKKILWSLQPETAYENPYWRKACYVSFLSSPLFPTVRHEKTPNYSHKRKGFSVWYLWYYLIYPLKTPNFLIDIGLNQVDLFYFFFFLVLFERLCDWCIILCYWEFDFVAFIFFFSFFRENVFAEDRSSSTSATAYGRASVRLRVLPEEIPRSYFDAATPAHSHRR